MVIFYNIIQITKDLEIFMRLFSQPITAILLCLLFTPLHAVADDSTNAIQSLLSEARQAFEKQEYERAASVLERAIRINQYNAVLWHNLAGISLKQKKWAKAASLAAKSNTFAHHNRYLRARNWVVIANACKGMNDTKCIVEAKRRSQVLSGQTIAK